KIQEATNGKDVDPAPIDKGKNIVSTVTIDPPMETVNTPKEQHPTIATENVQEKLQ
ncbi:unnamed protein product, partial [Ilex paraguariensis]